MQENNHTEKTFNHNLLELGVVVVPLTLAGIVGDHAVRLVNKHPEIMVGTVADNPHEHLNIFHEAAAWSMGASPLLALSLMGTCAYIARRNQS